MKGVIMSLLNQMIETTKKSLKDNIIIAEEKTKQEIKLKEDRKTTVYNSNSEEVNMIQSLGLKIDTYEPQDPDVEYYNAQEFYYCSNNRWQVYIRNLLYDADLGTILQVLNLTDKITGEKINFYCDLWCRNTGQDRLRQFKLLLEHSLNEYKEIEFGKYFNLPNLLKDNGYVVEENNFSFDTEECIGNLIVCNPNISETKCEIKIRHYNDKIINISKLKTNRYLDETISYSVNYNGEQDIQILCQQINKLIEHIDGKFGYLEDRFYTNEDVDRFFEEYKDKFDYIEDMTESYSYAHFYNENPSEEDIKEYKRISEMANINHYKGAEIYKKYELIVDRDTYHFGGIGNTYEFEIIYNTNIDKDNCILNITHILSDYVGWNNRDEDDYNFDNEKSEFVTKETIKGKYTYVMKTLSDFLDQLLEILK
jgi:hypothetical protein